MKLGKKLQTLILVSLSIIWIVALFLVYFPISGLTTPTFPFGAEYQIKINFFLVSTGLVSAAFFIKGFSLLQKPPKPHG